MERNVVMIDPFVRYVITLITSDFSFTALQYL